LCRFAGIFAVTAVLVGCVVATQQVGLVARIGAVSDVAQATDSGLEVLNANGSAADAVVAMAFMMAVERPDQVGLAGGGTCLVFDPEEEIVRLIDFPAQATGTGGAAVPAFLRGLAAIHADYGRLRWSEMVAIAETRLRLAPPGTDTAGRTAAQRLALADSLAAIRVGGIQAFYEGDLGRRYADGATADGFPLTMGQIQSSRLIWQEPATARFRNDLVSFGPATGGRDIRLAEAFTAAENGQPLAAGGASGSGLVAAAMSPDEMAVVCGLSFSPAGGGAIAGGTGIPVGGATPNLPSVAIHYNEPIAIPIDVAGSTAGITGFATTMQAAAVRGLAFEIFDPGPRFTGLLCQWDRESGRACRGVADSVHGGYGLVTETLLP
jgi:gamma-glutamyltranspeptidase/glutathione hydrolase